MRRRVANKVVNKAGESGKHKYKMRTITKAGRTADLVIVQRANRRMTIQMLIQYMEYVLAKHQQENVELAS